MKKILLITIVILFAFTACNTSNPVKTTENLKIGIKGETSASAKYAAFALRANEEGYFSVAKLFEAASKAESIHAANHKKVLEGLGGKIEDFTPSFEVKSRSTVENLKAAIEGEAYEITRMYPQFITDAIDEEVKEAEKSFNWAIDTEKKHLQFYTKAVEAISSKEEKALAVEYAVCPVCGNTYDKNSMDEKCAFCQTSKDKFILF